MAASKKNAKGSKTAHVLNLLTAPGAPKEGAPAGEESEAAGQAAPSRPLLPPILEVAQTNDDNLAQQIQQALEEELEEVPAPPAAQPPAQPIIEEVPPVAAELSPAPSGGKMSQEDIEKMLSGMAGGASEPQPPAPAPAPEPSAPSGGKMSQEDIEKMLSGMAGGAPEPQPPAPAPAPEPPAPSGGKMSQEDIEKMLSGMAGGAPEPQPEPAPEPAPPEAKTPGQEDDFAYINIIQTLVEEKAPQYIKKFGLCSCKHCEADVKALTLNNLVPKYVVLSKRDRIPMLTVYEGRYNTTIFAQLTRACKVVMDRPHHNRPV